MKKYKQLDKVNKHGVRATPERWRRGEIKEGVENNTKVDKLKHIAHYQTMYERKSIDLAQYSAAKKLNETWRAREGYHSSEHRERVDGGKSTCVSEAQHIAMDAYKKALDALASYKSIIVSTVIKDNPVTNKNMSGYQRRTRMKKFKEGLDILAKHYGFC